MKILVSVTDQGEAEEALAGAAHIIDVKNPREGSLGANLPSVISNVRKIVKPPDMLSATIGDMPHLPGTASMAALGAAYAGADIVKVGLMGSKHRQEVATLLVSMVRTIEDFGLSTKIVAACYGEFRSLGTISPTELPDIAASSGAYGLMIDTFKKTSAGLFDLLDIQTVREFVAGSHRQGLQVALSGGIKTSDIPLLCKIEPDIVGLRRAVCSTLTGRVSREKVQEITALINPRLVLRS